MAKKSFPLAEVYGLLEPGPVLLVSTAHRGKTNIMTISWHLMMEFEPPLVGCIISGNSYSFTLLGKNRQCVLNIPTEELAQQVVDCGNTSGRTVDKFKTFGLTPVASARVAVPRIEECHANLECKVVDDSQVDKYNLFILEVVQAWISPSRKTPRTLHHRGYGSFMVAGKTIRMPSKMR
ncbi:flavin reductase family protein [Thiovibrio sp. JS02]